MKKYFTFLLLSAFFINNLSAQKRPDHIVILMLENHGYSQIIGSSNAPFINSLTLDPYAASMTNSFSLFHPSQPNYIMLFSGSNQGVVNDNVPASLPFTAANLGASLVQKGFTFTGYSESLPSVGYTGATSGNYARKHSPWINWQGTSTNGIATTANQPYSAFPTNYSTLPTVSFVIPNLADDMHDSGTSGVAIKSGDTWVQNNLNNYIQWCKTNNSLLILTFDEDDDTPLNQITTIIIGQDIKGGSYNQPITHYNILRTVEDLYGLPYAGTSKDSSFIRNIWKTVTPVTFTRFEVKKGINNNILEWNTSSEENAAYFSVESSIDGKEFTSVGNVMVKGNNSAYKFIHNNQLVQYYRLRIVNNTGDYNYSKVLKLYTNANNTLFNISPNPANNNTVFYFNQPTTNGIITVFTMQGQIVSTYKISNGSTKYSLNTEGLKNGNYILHVKTSDGELSQKLFITK